MRFVAVLVVSCHGWMWLRRVNACVLVTQPSLLPCPVLLCAPTAVCTADFMMLVPRRHEAAGPVRCGGSSCRAALLLFWCVFAALDAVSKPHVVLLGAYPPPPTLSRSCNSVAFAGSIFVRSREEQQAVVQQGPLHILTATGYEW